MKIRSKTLGVLILIILFGGIFTASGLNLWKTESSKIPQRIAEGKSAGEYNPDDIRGSYSFGDISELFNIPLEDLRRAFGLSKDIDISNFKNKDLEGLYGALEAEGKEIGNGSVKFFVALYTGLPFDLDEDTYLPEEAVVILKNHSSLTAEQINYLDNHTLDISLIMNEKTAEEVKEEVHEVDERIIRGKTTFKEVLDWGVSKENIEEIISGKLPNPIMLIRDYCSENGVQYSAVKENLQYEVDKVK